MICRFRLCDIGTSFVIVSTLGDSQPCLVWGMCKLFAMSSMVGSVTLLGMLGRTIDGIGVVAVSQEQAINSPILIHCMFAVMKKWGVSDAFCAIVAHIWSINEDDWSYVLDYLLAILRTYDQFYAIAIGLIGRAIWILRFVCDATVVVCFLVDIFLNRLCYHCSNVAI